MRNISQVYIKALIYTNVILFIYLYYFFHNVIWFYVKNYFDVKMLVGKYNCHHFGSKLHSVMAETGGGLGQGADTKS